MRPLLFSSLCAVLLMLAACQRTDTVTERDEAGNRFATYQRDPKTGNRHGWYRRFYPNGNLFFEEHYRQGVLEGERTVFHPNGAVQTKEHYRNGLIWGKFEEFYDTGALLQTGEYVLVGDRTAFEGDLRTYYPSGQLKERVTMKAGMVVGAFEEYHENGKPKARGTYVWDGETAREQGKLEIFAPDGTIERVMACDTGICRTVD